MTQYQHSDRPEVMVIAAEAMQNELRDGLANVGFVVITPPSLLSAYAQMRRLLAPAPSARRILILVDLPTFDPGFSEFPAMLLIVAVAREMRLGQLMPAWLVALVDEGRPEKITDIKVAGCQHKAHLPLALNDLLSLRGLVEQPAPLPHAAARPAEAQMIEGLQSMANRVLHAVYEAQTHPWTPEDVVLLLCWLTPYPAWSSVEQQTSEKTDLALRTQQLVRALGGPRPARQRMEAIIAKWQTRYVLHGEILRKFLNGWERRRIVRYFVDRGLYEDSRVYQCIKELPRRIAEQLRREQEIHRDPGANE
jgi:hypothetical protein